MVSKGWLGWGVGETAHRACLARLVHAHQLGCRPLFSCPGGSRRHVAGLPQMPPEPVPACSPHPASCLPQLASAHPSLQGRLGCPQRQRRHPRPLPHGGRGGGGGSCHPAGQAPPLRRCARAAGRVHTLLLLSLSGGRQGVDGQSAGQALGALLQAGRPQLSLRFAHRRLMPPHLHMPHQCLLDCRLPALPPWMHCLPTAGSCLHTSVLPTLGLQPCLSNPVFPTPQSTTASLPPRCLARRRGLT